jgi:cysteine synthase A
MVDKGEQDNLLLPGGTIVEPTSGNTGIGLALIAASRGYNLILTMPESMSIERRNLLKGYGAKLVLTPADQGMNGAINKAKELLETVENAFMPSQFTNPENPLAHYNTTGVEIFEDTDGKVDAFVSGIGTGGTISGVGRYLKEKNSKITIVGVEPTGSPIITEGKKGPHKIQGIGAGFIPETLNTAIYDEVLTVSNEKAFEVAKDLAKTEGILVGISSGAALSAAVELAKREQFKGKTIVVLLPDNGDRYLSTALFQE